MYEKYETSKWVHEVNYGAPTFGGAMKGVFLILWGLIQMLVGLIASVVFVLRKKE